MASGAERHFSFSSLAPISPLFFPLSQSTVPLLPCHGHLPWGQLKVRSFVWPCRAGQDEGWPATKGCSEATGPWSQTGLGLWDHLPSIPASWQMNQVRTSSPSTLPPFRRACPAGYPGASAPLCVPVSSGPACPLLRPSRIQGIRHSDPSQQGVVKEVVFINGKQDSQTTMTVWTLLSYLQVDSSAFWMIPSFLPPGGLGDQRGLAVRQEPRFTETALCMCQA